MKEEKLKEIYGYLQTYIHQKDEHPEYIDYYDLYKINQSSSNSEIIKKIKNRKMKSMFHTDQVKFVDEEFRNAYLELVEEVKSSYSIFSDEQLRKRYDDELRGYQEAARYKFADVDISKEDEKNLDRAVETTIYKYGFSHGFRALWMAVSKEDYRSFTQDNGAREILKDMGIDKIRKILYQKRKDIMDDNYNNMTMDYYCDIISKVGLKEKAECFYNACFETALKYDVRNGNNQLADAIDRFIMSGDTSAFTNEHLAREELENSNIKNNDAYILVLAKLHESRKDNEKNAFSNTVELEQKNQIQMYANIMIKSAQKFDISQKK